MNGLIDDGHDVTLLTNFASRHVPSRRASASRFCDRPRGVTVSGDDRLIKPDRDDLRPPCRDASALEPAATLFIDDSQKNVDGARAAGWQAVLFQNAKTLEADLERLGIAP